MPINPERRFRQLLASKGVTHLSAQKALDRIALLTDLSFHLKREDGTVRVLQWCDDLQVRRLHARQGAELEYFRANAWANRVAVKYHSPGSMWQWEQPELQKEVLCLRRARNHIGFDSLPELRRCQVFTNLGNQLDTVGRFTDAIEYWRRALEIQARFAMAAGNRAYGLMHYAKSLYDPGHRRVFWLFAHDGFSAALAENAVWDAPYPGAKAQFQREKRRIEQHFDLEQVRSIDLQGHSLGRTREEQRYRRWCLRNTLFLNPLNDLGPYPIAAQDVLVLPTYSTPLSEGPTLIGFFNQLKQEYVSARWLLYEGTNASRRHFSDGGVKLYNTLDYPSYGLAVEKIKFSFRLAYSLFDKIAYFMNDYMQLSIPERDVYFRSLWFEKKKNQPPTLRVQFVQAENWPWRGLYWLAKDFIEKEFLEVMEPNAQTLSEIRNHLEHKYLKVHEMLLPRLRPPAFDPFADRLAYSISRLDLQEKTLRLFKRARSALIYLALGMHREEGLRTRGQKQGIRASMMLDILEESWKR
jgi:hypothetical protein